jgi:hypothetical protein
MNTKTIFILLSAFLVLGFLGTVTPAHAARVVAGYYAGPEYYYPYYPTYPPYYTGYYVAPPPVVYTVPPSPMPAPVAVPIASPAMSADQTSPTFTDSYGRTCRQFQMSGAPDQPPETGTACQEPDGSWRTVDE